MALPDARCETDLAAGVHTLVTPYKAAGWERALGRLGLLKQYYMLPKLVSEGFFLGAIPIPSQSMVPPVRRLKEGEKEVLEEWVRKELAAKRFEGPLSLSEVERKLGGAVVISPIHAVPKGSEPGKFRIVENLSWRRSPADPSVNDYLSADVFKTKWGTAVMIGNLVSLRGGVAKAPALLLLDGKGRAGWCYPTQRRRVGGAFWQRPVVAASVHGKGCCAFGDIGPSIWRAGLDSGGGGSRL